MSALLSFLVASLAGLAGGLTEEATDVGSLAGPIGDTSTHVELPDTTPLEAPRTVASTGASEAVTEVVGSTEHALDSVCSGCTPAALDGNLPAIDVPLSPEQAPKAAVSGKIHDGGSTSASGFPAAATHAARLVQEELIPDAEAAAWWSVGLAAVLAAVKGGALRLLPTMSLFSRIHRDRALDHPLRRRIMDVVEAQPGVPVRTLQDRTSSVWGTLVHHLRVLEDKGLIVSAKSGRSRCYWAASTDAAATRHTSSVLDRPAERQIADVLIRNPGLSHQGVAEATGIAPSTAYKALQRLEGAGLVSSARLERRRCYSPDGDLMASGAC